MSSRYEFGPAFGGYATIDEITHFEDVRAGDVYFAIGDPSATAYVLTGTDRADIVRQLEALLAEARTGVIVEVVDDPQHALFGFDNDHRVVTEFLYDTGEGLVTVEEHTHDYEGPVSGSTVWVCTECPASRLEEDLPEPEDDGAPCCRAQVTQSDPTEHEPGCYNDKTNGGTTRGR